MIRLALIATFGLALPLQFGGCAHGHKGFAPPGQVKKKTGVNPAAGKVQSGPVKIKVK